MTRKKCENCGEVIKGKIIQTGVSKKYWHRNSSGDIIMDIACYCLDCADKKAYESGKVEDYR